MSEQQHTAEPWIYVTADQSMIGERKFQIETLGGYAEREIITGWVSFDDARRIVACVNALAGVPTDHIERFNQSSIKDFSQDLSVRDEMLAALKGVVRVADRATVEFDAAIAKAEGAE